MQATHAAAIAAAVLAAFPAAAQVSNHGIAVESGVSTPLGGGSEPALAAALSASTWLDGDVEGTARVAWGSAGATGGRAAASFLSGTVGVRVSLGHGPLRPQVFAEVGWARAEADGVASDRAAFGAGAALEWFPAAEISLAPRVAIRAVGGEARAEVGLALGVYF
ncbi:MAG TPA: hypothetical protein VFK90_12960 [Anaeromyxobacter sp.]|nr:hypothetical protein [Anaeromyxobacter sp.]